jgi:hypothetical protein
LKLELVADVEAFTLVMVLLSAPAKSMPEEKLEITQFFTVVFVWLL